MKNNMCGWSLPATWECWSIMGLYLVIFVAAATWVPLHRLPRCLAGTVTVATSLCGVVAWKTGEPPHWRWGKDTSYPQYIISAKEGVTEY